MTDPEEIVRLYVEEGLSSPQIEALTGVNSRKVLRIIASAGIPTRRMSSRLTPEQRARAQQLLDDGLPGTWVAEDIGVKTHHIYSNWPRSKGGKDWASVWHSIRNNETLLTLHEEFAPISDSVNRVKTAR